MRLRLAWHPLHNCTMALLVWYRVVEVALEKKYRLEVASEERCLSSGWQQRENL